MNTFKRKSLFARVVLAAVVAISVAVAPITPLAPAAQAATPNYSAVNPSVQVLTFHVSGQYTATTAAVIRFAMPFKARLVGVGASARASGGTTPTLTVDVKQGGTTMLSAPFAVTAAAYSEGTITSSALADEVAVTVDLTIGGTTPTWNDITIVMTVLRT